MRAKPTLVGIPALLALGACGVSVQQTQFQQSHAPPRPADAPVQLFSTRVPECPYEEIGLLRADVQTPFTPRSRVLEQFLAHARRMGGEAVVLNSALPNRASQSEDNASPYELAGTVIHFSRSDCNR